jgi:hypothetical protein
VTTANVRLNDDGRADFQIEVHSVGNAALVGRGWFPIFRFYSPSEPYFDKSWVLNDIEKTH